MNPKKKQQNFTEDDHARVELDRKNYDEQCSSQTQLLDKSIISISGASFTISMGFIDKTIPLDRAIHTWILWSSLLILAITIIVTILSFEFGAKSAREWRCICDAAEDADDTNLLESKNKYLYIVELCNLCRLIFFLIGISALAAFIFINGVFNPQQSQRRMNDDNRQAGQSIHAPVSTQPRSGAERVCPASSPPLSCSHPRQASVKLMP